MNDEMDHAEREIKRLCERLSSEGVSDDAINAVLLDQAAERMANGEAAELMPDLFRRTADEMQAGDYAARRRPTLTVIDGGGGGSKV